MHRNAPLIRIGGRPLLPGGGCKAGKESRRMPGVKKLCQESEDSSKPQFIHGHMFGGIGGNLSDSLSHVIRMIRNGHAIAQTFPENVYFSLDRYFSTVPLLMELKGLNGSAAYRLDVITRARANCIVYAKPEKKSGPHRGRPRKKGESIKVMDLFESRKHDFIASTVFMYGKEQKVEYLSLNLLWGIKLYQELQFVHEPTLIHKSINSQHAGTGF